MIVTAALVPNNHRVIEETLTRSWIMAHEYDKTFARSVSRLFYEQNFN